MTFPDYFISCDWGTSNFRLRLVKTEDLTIESEHKTNQGVKLLHQKFRLQNELDQTEFFKIYLANQIKELAAYEKATLVVAAGMASSNIGMKELEYGTIPFSEDGSGLVYKSISFQNHLDILLISGVKSNSGMMRGEEVQAIGLASYLKAYNTGVLILPGTHSKHITYKSKCFTSLKSYMTGELFDVLTTKSILANSVRSGAWNDSNKAAFIEGLQIGAKEQLSANLFSIRARHLLQNRGKESNFFRLSGMLIGEELSYLDDSETTIFLAAPEPFLAMYKLALERNRNKNNIICFGDSVLENALLIGQKRIIELYAK